MTFKRKMWLNGNCAAQNEAVCPKGDIMNVIVAFGPEKSGCPLIINTTIRHIRSSTSVE